jgi:hypothetical protein
VVPFEGLLRGHGLWGCFIFAVFPARWNPQLAGLPSGKGFCVVFVQFLHSKTRPPVCPVLGIAPGAGGPAGISTHCGGGFLTPCGPFRRFVKGAWAVGVFYFCCFFGALEPPRLDPYLGRFFAQFLFSFCTQKRGPLCARFWALPRVLGVP